MKKKLLFLFAFAVLGFSFLIPASVFASLLPENSTTYYVASNGSEHAYTTMTDGNTSNYALSIGTSEKWRVKFSSAQTIESFIIWADKTTYTVNFYDSTGGFLGAESGFTSGQMKTFSGYTGVYRIDLLPTNVIYLYEGNFNAIPQDTTAPVTPSNIAIVASDSKLELNWNDNTETDLAGYNVYVDGVKHNVNLLTTSSYSISGLTNGQTYSVTVTAVDTSGNESAPSTAISGTPIAKPTAPTNVSLTSNSTVISISWNAVTGASGYNVKRATTSGGPYTTLASVTGTTYSDTTGVTGTTYYYVVSAVNAGGESTNSNEATITYNNTLSLNVESLVTTVQGLEQFTVDVKLKNASNIYAEDLTVFYDTTKFEFVSSAVGSAGLAFYHKGEATAGQHRYIIASQGRDYGINTNTAILKLTFKAKNLAGTGTIGISSGLVADSSGNEYTPALFGTNITVELNDADVNNDGKFSLGDLSIAAFDYLQLAGSVSDPDSDVDNDTSVNDIDLNLIVDAILSGV